MQEFSLDHAAESIYNPKTREYFREVLQSYISGNYRSSVVMLWTVVVCDLLYKLEELRDLHNDATASKILREVEDQERKTPKSPDWEGKLVEMIRERTALLDVSECQNVKNAQEQRHLSAHPFWAPQTSFTLQIKVIVKPGANVGDDTLAAVRKQVGSQEAKESLQREETYQQDRQAIQAMLVARGECCVDELPYDLGIGEREQACNQKAKERDREPDSVGPRVRKQPQQITRRPPLFSFAMFLVSFLLDIAHNSIIRRAE